MRRNKQTLKENVLWEIRKRKSVDPIKMKELGAMFSVSTRLIRESINSLRVDDNYPICGDNTGYFFPTYKSEWEITSRRLRGQAKSLFEAADGGDKYYRKLEDNQETMF